MSYYQALQRRLEEIESEGPTATEIVDALENFIDARVAYNNEPDFGYYTEYSRAYDKLIEVVKRAML